MRISILGRAGAAQEVVLSDSGEIIIGRDPHCGICLKDPGASRQHARIYHDQGVRMVEDLNSSNGTLLNGERLTRARLNDGDKILIGGAVLTVAGRTGAGRKRLFDAERRQSAVVMSVPHLDADLVTGTALSSPAGVEIERETRVLREICRICQVAAGETDRDVVLETSLRDLCALLQADTACLLTRTSGDEDWTLDPASVYRDDGRSLPISQTLMNLALSEGKAMLCADTLADSRLGQSQSIVMQGITSVVCAPVKIGKRFETILFLDRRDREEPFAPLDLRAAASVANVLGIFLAKDEVETDLRHKERLAAVGEALASLAHYIKNVITGFRFSLASMETAIAQQRHDALLPIVGGLSDQEHRMSDLILNMLSFVKERSPVPGGVDLDKLVDSVVRPYRAKLDERDTAFEYSRSPHVAAVRADELGLHRVLLNLLLNAMDALEARTAPGAKKIGLAVTPADGGIQLRFYDTGCGIPADKRPKLFTAFFSTKGSAGTGLGLAVVRKIVAEHGGTIRINPDV